MPTFLALKWSIQQIKSNHASSSLLIILSIVIIDFVFAKGIENWWAFPEPLPVIVIADPGVVALVLVADILNESLSILSTYTVDGTLPEEYCIAVAVTPSNVDPGVYVNASPVLKKWSGIVKVSPDTTSAGLKVFAKTGIVPDVNLNCFLLIRSPLIALYECMLKVSDVAP